MGKTVGLFGEEDLCELVSSAIEEAYPGEWTAVDITPSKFRTGLKFNPIYVLSLLFEIHKKFKNIDIVIFIFPGKYANFFSKIAKWAKTKTVYFWIGSDVLKLQKEGRSKSASFRNAADLHLADGEALQKELGDLGIESTVAYIVPSLEIKPSSMPEQHAVLLNIPDNRADFYNIDTCLRLANDYPELHFVAVRSNNPDLYPHQNIHFEGSVPPEEMANVYDQISIILRIPEHDSLSLVSMEGIARGKWIISRYPFPTSLPAKDYEQIKESLDLLLSESPQINQSGIEYFNEHFTQEKSGESIVQALEGLYHI